MKLRGLVDEDFLNYKNPSMFLIFPYCTFKCGKDVCQNAELYQSEVIDIDEKSLVARYIKNPITTSIVCGGLEPIDSINDLVGFLSVLRDEYNCMDDVVIYTGYTEDEISSEIQLLKKFKNIVCKYGRYIPGESEHFDEILGVNLASKNQYAVRIS